MANVDSAIPPAAIRERDQWVCWRYVQTARSTKPAKIPISAASGRGINPLKKENWVTFESAFRVATQPNVTGIGFVLVAEKNIFFDNSYYYLVAIDLDNVIENGLLEEARRLWITLGKTYLELSPSRKGLRMLVLTESMPLAQGNAGGGRELYFDKRFVSITGQVPRGQLCVATSAVDSLVDNWFGKKGLEKIKNSPGCQTSRDLCPTDETPRTIARVKTALSYISADCDYETWRNVVWGLLSTGWSCATEIAEGWSATAPTRFDISSFQTLVNSYDRERQPPLTLGTIFHEAKRGGWHASCH